MMRKKTLKLAALAAVAGTLLQFGGCLGGGFLQALAVEIAADTVSGFLNVSDLLGGLIPGVTG